MMGQHLFLEDFSNAKIAPQQSIAAPSGDDLQAIEKIGFDKGYSAGWEDALSGAQDSDKQSRADCATALQEIDFTYFEARQHVMASFKPLIEAMMTAILPAAARQAITPMVEQELNALADKVESSIEILCAPTSKDELETLVEQYSKGPVSVSTEDTLAPTQVQLRFGEGQTEIDMDEAVAKIEQAVVSFFDVSEQEERLYG